MIGNGLGIEKLIDPEGVPDDLFALLLPVLIAPLPLASLSRTPASY